MAIYFDKTKQRWRFDYQSTIAGQRVRATKLLPAGWTKAQAREYEAAEIARIVKEVGADKKPEPSIEDCVLAYLVRREGTKGHKSAKEHLQALYPYYAGKPLASLKAISLDVVEKRMLKPGEEQVRKRDPETHQYSRWSQGTVHNRLVYLHAACREPYVDGEIDRDPTRGMVIPVAPPGRQVYAERAQVLRIARACDRPDARALVLISFYTGMRLGEVMACTVADGAVWVPDSKNGLPRLVPIHPRIASYARRHLPFTTPRSTLQRAVERARERTASKDVTIHTLRHSAASAMVNAGVDLFAVGKVLGHKSTKTTARYAHLATETLAAAVSKIGAKKV